MSSNLWTRALCPLQLIKLNLYSCRRHGKILGCCLLLLKMLHMEDVHAIFTTYKLLFDLLEKSLLSV